MFSKGMRSLAKALIGERLFRRTIRLGGQKAPILVTPQAALGYLKPSRAAFDSELIVTAEKYIGSRDNVWDVGANVGVFSIAASCMTDGFILALEPDPFLNHVLVKNFRLGSNGTKNLNAVCAAASDQQTIAKFVVVDGNRSNNFLQDSLGRSQVNQKTWVQWAPTVTLDKLLEVYPKPQFVKVDVEGGEVDLLNGAKYLIDNVRPKFYIEVGAEQIDRVFSLFKRADYHCFDSEKEIPDVDCFTTKNIFFFPN